MILLYGYADETVVGKLARAAFGNAAWEFLPAEVLGTFPHPEQGQVLVGMGSEVCNQLKEAGYFPKNRTIASLREKPVQFATGGHALVTYSPSVLNSDLAMAGLLRWDLRLAHRLQQTGSVAPEIGTYGWLTVDGFVALVDNVCALAAKKPQTISLDLETMGYYPWYPDKHIVTIQLSTQPGTGHALHCLQDATPRELQERVGPAVRKLLTAKGVKLRGANLKFDLMWLWAKFQAECTNFKMDTLLVGSLLDENRSNSLSWHSKEYTPMGGYDGPLELKYDKGKMELVPKADLLPYAAGDTDACLRASDAMLIELQRQPGLMRFYNELLHPAVRAFEKIERRGLYVDVSEFHKLEEELTEDMAKAHAEAIDLLPPRLKMKHAGKLDLGKPGLKADYLFGPLGLNLKPLKMTEGGQDGTNKKPSTDAAHMKMLGEAYPAAQPFCEAFQRWSGAQRMLSTYVTGFLKHLRPDGRFHPTYMLFNGALFESSQGGDKTGGTVTGRTSAKDPAVQTIPKHLKKGHKPWPTKLRKCYPAPQGYVFFEADFSQGELRVTACVANEQTMLNAYAKNMDLHCVTGAGFAKMSYEDFQAAYLRMDAKDPTLDPKLAELVERFRQVAKSANFGLLYGMGVEGYRIYARDQFGVVMTYEEAEASHDSFFKTYGSLPGWHRSSKRIARDMMQIVSPLGRVRHLPLIRSRDRQSASEAERQAINSPIQSCLSDMCLWSIAILEERWGDKGLEIAGMTHDSIYGYVRKDMQNVIIPDVTNTMATLPLAEVFGWEPQIPFPADVKVGPSWAEIKKWKPVEMAAAA